MSKFRRRLGRGAAGPSAPGKFPGLHPGYRSNRPHRTCSTTLRQNLVQLNLKAAPIKLYLEGKRQGGFSKIMSQTNSPVTGVIDEKSVIIDFGKYEGKTVEEIAELDRAFYDKLVREKDSGVFAIRRNRDKTFRL